MASLRFFALAALVAGCASIVDARQQSMDYPQWRGPNRDGSAASFAEPKTWPENLTLKWKVEIGPGYPTPIVVGSRIYTHTRRDDAEVGPP